MTASPESIAVLENCCSPLRRLTSPAPLNPREQTFLRSPLADVNNSGGVHSSPQSFPSRRPRGYQKDSSANLNDFIAKKNS
ncbi:hypothetical protein EVAR_18714_1 [Eumeta japonica]|uniref:Uncharacterized protein n=1 Tax=Eumeta variegata TaxID=151549 RepID=A0A4C1UM48_EUMVA|nr:hypothetical protein EVAR_18714_1 [Eumeta japonica]